MILDVADMRLLSVTVISFTTAYQAGAFCPFAGRPTATSSRWARAVQASSWRTRPFPRSPNVLAATTGSTYAEYMALRSDKEAKARVQDDPPEADPNNGSKDETSAVSAPDGASSAPVMATVAAELGSADAQEVSSSAQTPATEESATSDVFAEADIDADPGEDSKPGDEEREAEVVLPSESRTELLSKRVGAEAEMATSRARRMADLTTELRRSFARKEEVEKAIASEIGQLSLKLQQERDIEIAREADLRGLLNEFDETITEKQQLIESEQDLLAQMQALREQVEEPSIKAPIESAMAKKADVTSIEVMLLEDLVECKEKLAEELKSTSSRADTMNGVVAALPAEEDTVRMRAYNWQDVEDLQEVLLSSMESMEASDAQVGSLRTKLLDSVRQKRQVLGETTSTELVSSSSADGRAKKMTVARAFEASRELTEDELLSQVAQSTTSTAVGVVKTVAAGVSSLGNYARSPEAQDVAASTVDAIGAISGAASALGDALKEAKKEFDEKSLPNEELTSFDKIFRSVQSGARAVGDSETVKAKLGEAGDYVRNQLPEAGVRVGKGAAVALKGAAANEEIKNPVRDALDSAEKFIVSMAALGSKWFANPKAAYFQLPGGKAGEGRDEPSPPREVAALPAKAVEAGDAVGEAVTTVVEGVVEEISAAEAEVLSGEATPKSSA